MFWLAEVFNGSFSADELRRREQYARQQRAQTVARLASAAGRGLSHAAIGAGHGLAAAYRAYRTWQRKRAAIRELNGLSDKILRDIGMTRGDIRTVVEDMANGKPETRTVFRVFTSGQPAPVAGSVADYQAVTSDWQRAA